MTPGDLVFLAAAVSTTVTATVHTVRICLDRRIKR